LVCCAKAGRASARAIKKDKTFFISFVKLKYKLFSTNVKQYFWKSQEVFSMGGGICLVISDKKLNNNNSMD
jgi:hypothetical protein